MSGLYDAHIDRRRGAFYGLWAVPERPAAAALFSGRGILVATTWRTVLVGALACRLFWDRLPQHVSAGTFVTTGRGSAARHR
jgi:hypothetical protein